MIQIRIHGRGGQGVVTAAELIALSAFYNGQEAQAFPFFGVERSGAPIMAFARIDKETIKTKEQVYHPDFLIIQDDSLASDINILQGLSKETVVIINSAQTKEDIFKEFKEITKQNKQKLLIKLDNIITASATEVALKIIGKNLINTVMLGVLAKNSNLFSLESAILAVKNKFAHKSKDLLSKNIKAIKEIYVS